MNSITGGDILQHADSMGDGPMGSARLTRGVVGALTTISVQIAKGDPDLGIVISDILVLGTRVAIAALDLGDPVWEV